MQNYTNTKHPNSRKFQKEKHIQVAVTGGTALGGIKPNTQIIRKLDPVGSTVRNEMMKLCTVSV